VAVALTRLYSDWLLRAKRTWLLLASAVLRLPLLVVASFFLSFGATYAGGRAASDALPGTDPAEPESQDDLQAGMIARVAMDELVRLDLSTLLARLAERMTQASGAACGAILLFDRRTEALRPGAYYGYGDEDLSGLVVPLGKGFAGRVAAERRPIQIFDVLRERNIINQSIRRRGIRSLLGVPIAVEGQLLGVAHVDRLDLHEFSPREVRRLSAMAAQAALGIHYAVLYTELKASNAELAQTNRKLQAVVGTIPTGVAILDAPAGRVISANVVAERLWGHRAQPNVTLEDMPAAYGLFRLNGDPYFWRNTPMARSLREGETVLGEDMLLRRADGQESTVIVSSAPLHDSTGRVEGAVVVFQDTSGLELERAKDQFVAVTAHELFTPLTVIKGMAQLLERKWQADGQDGQVGAALNIIVGKTDLMAQLLQKLADASELQLSPLELRRRPVDLVALTRQTVQRFRPGNAKVEIVVSSKEERLVGDWDRDRVRRVLLNLLDNAVKYSPDGGQIEVAIRLTNKSSADPSCRLPGSRWAVVRITDHGLGISPEQQAHLFQRFYRAGPAQYQESPGLGLGLYIANRMVVAHGGRMHVRSAPGRGSRFFFALPLD
jgi:signal transduction histidine kinase